ncbi:sterol desaturase family protein [Caulobacter hibisci]|uniref:Sterol desaturase family protein n=1 Tax=Caulobacter hibisci TaxID=2035993 RepID=A0ABS0T7Z0_9CAUL|nr:sterol desaturase family protein [Caulobacter hibisci]MBI1686983.1 sterol desaturase family protein [Caulobacter hibisci]
MDPNFLIELATAPLLRPLTFNDPFSLWSLLGAALTAAVFFRLGRRKRPVSGKAAARRRDRALLAYLAPKRMLRHASTRLDLKFYLVTSILFAAFFALWPLTSMAWKALTVRELTSLFGPGHAAAVGGAAGWGLALLATALYALVFDFSYYLVHRLLHEVPALWEFHKVHHSAEVMTPLTEWRQHPVEGVAFPLGAGFFTGIAQGVMVWAWGPDAQPVGLFGVNLVMLAYIGSVLHLRHSHVWMPFRGWLGHLLQSPAHHQIHHSMRPEHFGKNLGFALSLFDWLLGTLAIPPKRDPGLDFGLTPAEDHGKTLVAALVEPFGKAWDRLLGRPAAAPGPLPAE